MKFNFTRCLIISLVIFSIKLNSQPLQFTDVAGLMGINSPIQFIRGSVSFCDFNGDGLDDLSFSSAQEFPLFIYKSEGTSFTNVTFDLQLYDSLRTMQLLW